MLRLPPEISFAIINGLDVTQPNDRKTLHSLLFVSKQVNVFALRTIYQDISFLNRSAYDQFFRQLCLFSCDIESNPGLRFTTVFSCRLALRNRDGEAMIRSKEVNRTLESIIPFLINVRRMSISVDDGFAYPHALRSLPPSAPLTHLKIGKCGMCSEDFQQFLASRPTLEWLSIYSSRPGSARAVERNHLTIDALPRLLSLSIDAEDTVFFENPLTSLVNLACNVRYISQMDSASIVCRMAPFASVTACHLRGAYYMDISPILTSLPHLEYLWVGKTELIVRTVPS
ncbi:hypothetical protein BDN71DRAFT_467714 [Pleurotus eryngii]|uniref:Uncharacterized protein n=1 Tax=Pleurotus eryngii TaxID=5323 RepID=A0A9P5ZJG0_PLEER|nr:hypothetical protein BDN71DRAFT_467714 [Pleurotus eryngii]